MPVWLSSAKSCLGWYDKSYWGKSLQRVGEEGLGVVRLGIRWTAGRLSWR
jgi:hypothetical protein